jgi:hypothetical protein
MLHARTRDERGQIPISLARFGKENEMREITWWFHDDRPTAMERLSFARG